MQHWCALRAANLRWLGSIPRHVSKSSRCWTARGLLGLALCRSGQVRHLAGAPASHSSSWLRMTAFHAAHAGSNPACDAPSRPVDPAAGLRSQLAKVRLLLGTQLALARGSSVAPPKRDYAVRLGTRAPQASETALHAGLITRKNRGSTPRACIGDNARRGAALIRPAKFVVRVHLSPLRDRLAVG